MPVNILTGTGNEYRPWGDVDIRVALAPYQGPWNLQMAAHLLRRAGFGGTPDEIATAADAGMHLAVDKLLQTLPESLPDRPQADLAFGPMTTPAQRIAAVQATQLWWLNRMLLSPNQLHEKMVYFWSSHFTSVIYDKGISPGMMVAQNDLFRKYALGNYDALTHEIAKDPAMLRFLDGALNRKQHPNENFARELMELFTMGIGNYTEVDVREAARAFTGYSLDKNGAFIFYPGAHDDGPKTVLGHTGSFTGDDVIDVIMRQPATGRYIARKFLRAFVYDDPEPALVELVAERFRVSGYDAQAVLDVLLRSNVFYSGRAYRSLVRSPIELAIATHRMLGATQVGLAVLYSVAAMGQAVMQPPNVSGWPGGAMWLNSNSILQRLNFLNRVVFTRPPKAPAPAGAMMAAASGTGGGGAMNSAGMMGASAALPLLTTMPDPRGWIAGTRLDDPNAVADRVLSQTVQDDVTPQQRQTVIHYLTTDGVGNPVTLSTENIDEKLRGAMSLAMALPTYQLM